MQFKLFCFKNICYYFFTSIENTQQRCRLMDCLKAYFNVRYVVILLMNFQSPKKEASEHQSQEDVLLSDNNEHRWGLSVCVLHRSTETLHYKPSRVPQCRRDVTRRAGRRLLVKNIQRLASFHCWIVSCSVDFMDISTWFFGNVDFIERLNKCEMVKVKTWTE